MPITRARWVTSNSASPSASRTGDPIAHLFPPVPPRWRGGRRRPRPRPPRPGRRRPDVRERPAPRPTPPRRRPAHQQHRRQLQQPRPRAGQRARQQAGRQAVDHDRAGRGDGEQVGGHGGQRQRSEHDDATGATPSCAAIVTASAAATAPDRAAAPPGARREQRFRRSPRPIATNRPRGRAAGRRSRMVTTASAEQPHRAGRSAGGHPGGGQRGHDRRPDHRRLEAGQRREPADQAQRAAHRVGVRRPRSSGPASARRNATFSPDTAVEMRQTGGAELPRPGWRLAAVVTDDEAEVQAAIERAHGPRAPFEQLPHPVGGVGEWRPSLTSSRRAGRSTPTMWRLRSQRRWPRSAATIRDPRWQLLAGQPGREPPSGAAERPQLQVVAAPATTSAATPATERAGIRAQGDDAVKRPHAAIGLHRLGSGPCPGGQGGHEEARAEDHGLGPATPPEQRRRHAEQHSSWPRPRDRQPRPGHRGGAHRHDGPSPSRAVAQPTAT